MKPRTRDNLTYLAVGLSIAALLTADFFYADSRGREMWMPSRFALRLVYSTALMVYFVVRETRRVKATVVQMLMCVLFAVLVHLAIAFGFRQAVGDLPGLSFAALAVPEMFVIVLLMVRAAQYLRSAQRS